MATLLCVIGAVIFIADRKHAKKTGLNITNQSTLVIILSVMLFAFGVSLSLASGLCLIDNIYVISPKVSALKQENSEIKQDITRRLLTHNEEFTEEDTEILFKSLDDHVMFVVPTAENRYTSSQDFSNYQGNIHLETLAEGFSTEISIYCANAKRIRGLEEAMQMRPLYSFLLYFGA